jgi:hypothetical protein
VLVGVGELEEESVIVLVETVIVVGEVARTVVRHRRAMDAGRCVSIFSFRFSPFLYLRWFLAGCFLCAE